MAIGGVGANNFGAGSQGANTAGTQGNSEGKEFALEKQATGSKTAGEITPSKLKAKEKTTKIVSKGKRNRKGAPRSVLVDGEIWEVYLLAIA